MSSGRRPSYRPGDHWVECQVCSFTYRSSEMRKRWDGLIVCKPDWEPRHPQDFVRVMAEDTSAKGLVNPNRDPVIEVGYVDACYWVDGYAVLDLPCFDIRFADVPDQAYVKAGYWFSGYTTED